MAGVQLRALDFAGLDHIFGKRLEHSLLLKWEPQCFHAAYEAALTMANRNQRGCQRLLVPVDLGPIRQSMNIALLSPHDLR